MQGLEIDRIFIQSRLDTFHVNRQPGRQRQTATLLLTNGEPVTFVLEATGIIQRELLVTPKRTMVEMNGQLTGALLLTDNTKTGEVDPPTVRPQGIRLHHFGGWEWIESPSQVVTRPTRQMAKFELDFTQYPGQYPVDVEIEITSGLIAILHLEQPPSVDVTLTTDEP